ncbi:MAG: TolC family protein [Lentimicrobiaceae bacterium]|nr:TolC family protein [Lentimicrobiaceae bacterium]
MKNRLIHKKLLHRPILLRVLFLCCVFHLLAFPVPAQDKQEQLTPISLDETIRMARERSREALAARHRFRSSYWSFRTYRATYLPKLNLESTLPNLQRAITKYTLPDGEEAFIERSYISYAADLSLSKKVGALGGTLSLRSSLQRIDNFNDSMTTAWLSDPLTIGYTQPLFTYNAWKWDSKIAPLRFAEARKRYIQDLEDVSLKAIGHFFSLLQSEIRLKIARTNEANYDTLYRIATGRFNLGKIAENELLQLELSLLRARSELEQAVLDQEINMFRLRSFLRMPEEARLFPVLPEAPPQSALGVEEAIAAARENRPEALAMERQLLESESAYDQARANSRLNAQLFALYGLTQRSDQLREAYRNPQDQQQINVGIQLPIIDWGLARGQIRMAESDLELTRIGVEQQRIDFDQDVYLQVMRYAMMDNQFRIAGKADTVASKRFEVTKQRYLIGRISITDLNIAQTESDNAGMGYADALRQYWYNYFELRRLTLMDPAKREPLQADFESLMQR